MNSTKKTFLTSLMALLLCIVMLMGTTFAWFTDVVTSTGNIIQAGNLDAEMYYSESLENPDWKNADGPAVFNYENWEPGYTAVRYIKIKNAGNFNFKFQLSLDANGVVSKLGDVIDVYFVNPANQEIESLEGLNNVGVLTNVIKNSNYMPGTLTPGSEVILAIALHMQEEAGNEYQKLELCEGGFDLKLIATQVGGESDSFGDDYDDNATWEDTLPEQSTASSAMELNADGTLPVDLTFANDDGTISITVPAGTKFKQGTKLANLNVNKLATSGANITLEENEETRSFDVHVANLDESNTEVISIAIKEFLPAGLNMGNYKLYHVEDGQTLEMQLLADGEAPVHNSFNYDPATGDVVLHLASFSEVALVADTEKAWEGKFDYSWYDADATELTIANADQLAAFGAIVGGMNGKTRDSFAGKTVKLISDINLGDKESENNSNLIFYPIGYNSDDGKYEKTGVAINSSLKTFEGTFDGNGHTVANFYQNTWEMKGDHNWYTPEEQYYRDGMGLFGRVYKGTIKNLTVKNFSSDGEIATTGVIAAYADGATFENIAIFNCNPRVYNIGNGGIVGCVGWYAKEADLKTTFKNITVDNSNKISALWGSYDVACGGIVGQYYPTSGQSSVNYPVNGGISFENCHISAQMDVYNDVCANYQYYAYRYTGMLIGSVRENVTIDGHSYPKMDGITAKDCTVHFGTWNDYYYCEIIDNTTASYTHDYQMSRLTEIKAIDGTTITYLDGTTGTVPASGRANYVIVDYSKGHGTENATCYHFKDGEVWNHEDGGKETINGVEVLKEDKQHIYLEFNNLVTGYGWGVTTKVVGDLTGVTILDREVANSVEKFEGKVNQLVDYTTYTLADIFKVKDGLSVEIVHSAITVSIVNLNENGNVVAKIDYDQSNWENTKITFTGTGSINITIQDYYFCVPTTINVNISGHDHSYDNGCDTTCNECGETRETKHIYDNACDTTCNVCDDIRSITHDPSEPVKENVVQSTCIQDGHYESVVYCSVCGTEMSREHKIVGTNEHTPSNPVVENEVAPTCTEKGSYDSVTYCAICNAVLNRVHTEIDPLGHTEVIDSAVAATCTTTGLTEGKHCSTCNEVLVAQKEVAANGHSYDAVVTAPTCTTAGYSTYTCSSCDHTYTADGKESLGHIKTKFTGDFLYRVGNQNAVELSSLFNVGDRKVTVTGEKVAGNASVDITGTSLKFNGTGVVKLTLTSDCTCGECDLELTLEVVDAVNATGAMNATDNNVVLLNDSTFTTLEVTEGYTLYGNGFTLRCLSDSYGLNLGTYFVKLENGTLDNVQIVCPNFDYATLYDSNMKSNDNRKVETSGGNRYYNVRSAVMVSGNSQILNSRISGGRAAVNVTSGNCLIDNTRIELGAVASLLVGAANSLTLRDVTLIQGPTPSTYDPSKVIMGFSVLYMCDGDGNSTETKIEGTLIQQAWVDESDSIYVPSAGSAIISEVLAQDNYVHSINGVDSINLGFAYMPLNEGGAVKEPKNITDNRSNKADVPYANVRVGNPLTGYYYVYSYKNEKGTDSLFVNETDYKPNKYSDIITVNYADTSNGLEAGKSFGTSGWVYELNVDLDKLKGYELDFSKLTMSINGVTVNDYKVNGNTKPSTVAVTAGGVVYTLTATVNGKDYTAIYKVTGTETSKESPSLVGTPSYSDGFVVSNSYDGDWSAAASVLDGITIKYWSVAESDYKEVKLSDIKPGKTGKLNGANSYWEYTDTNNDFTLKLTNTNKIHDGKGVYGMPIGGSDGKLYFTISDTKGFVSTSSGSRVITIKYEFTDNNGGDTLVFEHTWNVSHGDIQYSYNNLVNNGNLNQLEASSSPCVTPDTLITLADGTQVRVDSLTGNEELLVWNMETGKFDKAPIMFLDSDAEAEYEVIKLYFSDGTEVKVIYEHGFWDYDLNKYVYLDKDASQYIGHTFAKQNGDKLEKVQLVDVVIEKEMTTAWSPVTVGHLCYFVNGMLSMPGGVGGLFNIFEVDPETMTYDYEQLEKDIETYGLFTYEELNAICPLSEDMFNAAGGAYLKISIGKGNLTMEELVYMITRYSVFFE